METIEQFEEQIAMLKNAAAQVYRTSEERYRLMEEAVKLEIKVMQMKNGTYK